jgi:hypothetical protein
MRRVRLLAVIRVRRVNSGLPLVCAYELEFAANEIASPTERANLRRGAAVRRLERDVGTGDAWSFITAADRAWDAKRATWAVEYESPVD